jgi:phage gp45-like
MVMTPPLQRVIDRLRREINNRINGAIQRVVLSALDDSGGLQVATVKGVGDHVRRAERIQPAGLTSSPTAGEGVQVAIGGNTDHPIVVALENRAKRPNTAPGETKLYNEFGSEVHQKIDGTTEIHAGGAVLGVARLHDTTTANTAMTTWLAQMGVAINQIAVIMNVAGPVIGAPGSVTPVAPPTPSDFGKIAAASSTVKVE